MDLIDRYIARQYLINIAALLVMLFAFVVVIDISINIDRFWRLAGRALDAEPALLGEAVPGEHPPLSQAARTASLVVDLWWPRLLQLFNLVIGLVLVGAMGFTCSQLVRKRELVAVLASGQSLQRVARPVLVVALAMTTIQALNRELVIPSIAPKLIREHSDAGSERLRADHLPLTPDARNRLWYARTYNPQDETLSRLDVWERDERGVAYRRLSAERAAWDPASSAWVLESVRIVNAPIENTGAAPGIESVDRVALETDLDPTGVKVRRFSGYGDALSWVQISRMLEQTENEAGGTGGDEQIRARLERMQFGRVSLAATNILTLIITLPFFLTRAPGNMVAQALRASPVAIAALMGGVLGAAAPIPGVPPAVAVFIPVMILLPVAVAMTSAVRT